MMNDIDEAVRSLRSHLDQPSADALSRMRSRALAEPSRRVRRRIGWIALPAVATGVAAVTVTASLLAGQTPVTQPTLQPAAPTTPSLADITAANLEAWALELEQGSPAPPVAPGQTIIVRTQVIDNGSAENQEITVQREGLLIIDNGEFGDLPSFQQYVADQRALFEQEGPSWRMPTAAWLEALDPSTASILAEIGAALCEARCELKPAQVWNSISDLVAKADVVLPPALRAGLLRTLATLPGVYAYEAPLPETATFRRQVILSDGDNRYSLFIDPAAGRFVGTNSEHSALTTVMMRCGPLPSGGTAEPCVTPTLAPMVDHLSATSWEQTLVTP